jgi:alanyl-tRNA synthetase
VDTGMGFERLCVVLQGKDSVYETDLFTDAMKVIQSYAMSADEMTALMQRRLRIVADHARTAFMLINDGLIPSNVGAGYVLRMIIRRMVYNMILIHEISLDKYADFIQRLLVAFQGLREFQEEEIIRVMMGEVSLFQKTIQAGKKILDEMLKA